jgi:hypothetical protein
MAEKIHKYNKESIVPSSLSALLLNSQSALNFKDLKTKKIELKKKPSKKQTTSKKTLSKEALQIISYQNEQIHNIKQEKAKLQSQILELESQLASLKDLPVILNKKKRKISKLKLEIKKKVPNELQKILTKTVFSCSHRSTPRIKADNSLIKSLSHFNGTYNASKIIQSQPLSTKNSENSAYPISLQELLLKTEKTLKNWKRLYFIKKLNNF